MKLFVFTREGILEKTYQIADVDGIPHNFNQETKPQLISHQHPKRETTEEINNAVIALHMENMKNEISTVFLPSK